MAPFLFVSKVWHCFVRPIFREHYQARLPLLCLLAFSCLNGLVLAEGSAIPREHNSFIGLALNQTWLRLLHLEKGARGGFRSDIRSPEFFLSPSPVDPLREMRASIEAFNHPWGELSAVHPICRFPARYVWLKQRLPARLSERLPALAVLIRCELLQDWNALQSDKKINLVHVSGYLGNPGSAFGHLLLRIGNESEGGARGLLDTGINFGAQIPPGEGTLSYIVKGIGGGYGAGFSTDRHYLRDHVYAATEARDMWVYKLALTAAQRQLLLLHLWELRDLDFKYFFLRRNCAWRIAELLELVLDENFLPSYRPYYLPVDVFHTMHDLKREGREDLVENVAFLASNKRSVIAAFDALPVGLQLRLSRVLDDPARQTLEGELSREGLDFMIDFSALAMSEKLSKEERAGWGRIRQDVLQQRLKLPVAARRPSGLFLPPPGEGLRHQKLSLFATGQRSESDGVGISFAPFSYDKLDRNRGSLSSGEFRGGEFEFINRQGSTRLERLLVLEVARLHSTPRIAKSRFGTAWRGGLGARRDSRVEAGKLRPSFHAAYGKTLGAQSFSFYGMLALQANLKSLALSAGPVVGAVSLPSGAWSYNWESAYRWDSDSGNRGAEHSLAARYRLNPAHALDFGAKYRGSARWAVSYQFRW